MSDLIPLAELLSEIDREIKRVPACAATLQRARSIALTIPTVDAEPVVHAYWKLSPLPGRPLRAVCSWCGAEGLFSYNMHDAVMYYCHKCGARMDADDLLKPTKHDAPERAGKGNDGDEK